MENCLPFHSWNLPFHSILASSIFHTKISVSFHSIFHSIPYHALHDGDIIISSVYRHPKNDAQVFIDALNTNVENVRSNKVFLVGDFNLNIRSLSDLRFPDRHASVYLDMLISNGYYTLINVPTRVTDSSSTITDHITINDHAYNISSGVIKTDLTNHYPVFCTISNLTLKISYKSTFRHFFSMCNADDFCNHLNNEINSFFLTISYIDDDIFILLW